MLYHRLAKFITLIFLAALVSYSIDVASLIGDTGTGSDDNDNDNAVHADVQIRGAVRGNSAVDAERGLENVRNINNHTSGSDGLAQMSHPMHKQKPIQDGINSTADSVHNNEHLPSSSGQQHHIIEQNKIKEVKSNSTSTEARLSSTCPDIIQNAIGVYNNINGTSQQGFENVLLLVSSNFAYLDFLVNWEYLANDKHGMKYGIVAMDIPLYEHLGDKRSILSDKLQTSSESEFFSKGFADISCNKLAVVLDIMDKCDVDIVFSDVDNIFIEDPFQHDLGRLIKMQSYDYIYLPNWRTAKKRSDRCLTDGYDPGEANTGFYYLSKKNSVMKDVLKNTLKVCAEPTNNKDDQTLFWREWKREQAEHSWYHCSAENGYETRPQTNTSADVNLCCLDPYYYHIGLESLVGGNQTIARNTDLITYHGNFAKGKEAKIGKMKAIPHGWNLKHLQSVGKYDANNKPAQDIKYNGPPQWGHIYNKSQEGEYFKLCNRKIFVDKMPSSQGGPMGLPGWRRHPTIALMLFDSPGWDKSWGMIHAFLQSFDVAFDKELSLVVHESQLTDLFLGLKQNGTGWEQRLEDIFGIIVSSDGSKFSSHISYNTSHLIGYRSQILNLDMKKKHRHYVLQNVYQLTAENMMKYPNSPDTNSMCCDLRRMLEQNELISKSESGQFTALHGQYELPSDLIMSILNTLGMNTSSVVMITGDDNKDFEEKISSHTIIGQLVQTIPKDSCAASSEKNFSQLMLAIASDVFIGSAKSDFARYVAHVRFALGVGSSCLASQIRTDDKWEKFCDEDDLYNGNVHWS